MDHNNSESCATAPEVKQDLQTAPPPAPTARPAENSMSGTKVILLALVVSVLSSACSVWTYHQFWAQKIVAIDIKTFVEDTKAAYIAGKLDDVGLKREMDKLEAAVASVRPNEAVLMGDLVVRNVKIIKP